MDLMQRLEASFAAYGGKTAIEGPVRSVSFADIDLVSLSLADSIRNIGWGKGDVIAIHMEDVAETIIAMIGVLRSGAAFLLCDPDYPLRRLEYMVSASGCIGCLFESASLLSSRISPDRITEEIVISNAINACQFDSSPLPGRTEASVPMWELKGHLCYLCFTSGSVGVPKAICGTIEGLAHFVEWEIAMLPVNDSDRFGQLYSCSFDAFLRDVFVPLCAGATICLPPSKELIKSAADLVGWIDQARLTVMHTIPTLFRSALNEIQSGESFPMLRYVLMAGEKLNHVEIKKWLDLFGDRIRLVNMYGTTETSLAKTFHVISTADLSLRAIPAGKPLPDVKVLVLDDSMRPCPPGISGEIYICPPFPIAGYYKLPELNTKSFIFHESIQGGGARAHKTGDVGRFLPSGDLEVIGRKDNQVKVGGIRLELEEVECALAGFPGIVMAAAKQWKNESGDSVLFAYAVSSVEIIETEVRRHLAGILPAEMVPVSILIMDKLPTTLSGKLDRKGLPKPSQLINAGKIVEPRNDMEAVIAGTWVQVLNWTGPISIDYNFFAIGGSSLKATLVLSRLNEAFAARVDLKQFFISPTIAGLALRILENKCAHLNADEMADLLQQAES